MDVGGDRRGGEERFQRFDLRRRAAEHHLNGVWLIETNRGLEIRDFEGSPADMNELKTGYESLKAMRAEAIKLGILPPVEKWGELNQHLASAKA